LRPWVSHDAIAVWSSHDPDGDGDADGSYPLGATDVEFTLTDVEGNQRGCLARVEVRDTRPPALLGVPDDADPECGEALPDPAAVVADDACEPDLPVLFVEDEQPRGCPANRDLHRRWSTADSSGHAAQGEQFLRIRDTQPPTVTPSDDDLHCFRAANHWLVELTHDDFSPVVTDACSEVLEWFLVGCESDQPADDRGDGRTAPDCVVAEDGRSLLVRGERDGRKREGRRYGVTVVAVDACGNWSEPARIGFVRILHDLRGGEHDCPILARAGRRD
jgi:hypothetical protein